MGTGIYGALVGLGQQAAPIGNAVGEGINAAIYGPKRRRVAQLATQLFGSANLDPSARTNIQTELQSILGELAASGRDEDRQIADVMTTRLGDWTTKMESFAEQRRQNEEQRRQFEVSQKARQVESEADRAAQRNLQASGAKIRRNEQERAGVISGDLVTRSVADPNAPGKTMDQVSPLRVDPNTGLPTDAPTGVSRDVANDLESRRRADEDRRLREQSLGLQREQLNQQRTNQANAGMGERMALSQRVLGVDPDTGEARAIPAHFVQWIQTGDEGLKPRELGGTVGGRGSTGNQAQGSEESMYTETIRELAGRSPDEALRELDRVQLDADPMRRRTQIRVLDRITRELEEKMRTGASVAYERDTSSMDPDSATNELLQRYTTSAAPAASFQQGGGARINRAAAARRALESERYIDPRVKLRLTMIAAQR